MKKFFYILFALLAILTACTKEVDVPDASDTLQPRPDVLILGAWTNLPSSYMRIIQDGQDGRLFFDPHTVEFSFGNNGILVMEYKESDLFYAGIDTVHYVIRNDSLFMNDGGAYAISTLSNDSLVLDCHELLEGADYEYFEHIEMVRK